MAIDFASISTIGDMGISLPDFPHFTELSDIAISALDVSKLIKNFDTTEATGSDKAPVVFLQKYWLRTLASLGKGV